MKTRRLGAAPKRNTVAGLRRVKASAPTRAHQARLVSVAPNGRGIAELAGHPGVPVSIRLGIPLDGPTLAAIIARQQPVLLLNAHGDDDLWLIAVEQSVGDVRGLSAEPALPGVRATAVVDGKRVELRGEDEIVLSCGQASITLRRNGRVLVHGTYIETRSKGVNRIKGGSVQIN
jgi:hypothetical protein